MLISRRNFLHALGAGAALGATGDLPLPALARAARLEPPRAAAANGPILLNSNENAYGPSPQVKAVLEQKLSAANRYPYMEYPGLQKLIANQHGVSPEQVLMGCGSTEILRCAACAFLGRGGSLVQAGPTFEAIAEYAHAVGARVASLPLAHDFAHDLEAMLAKSARGPALFYICNPNNPTGSLTPRAQIEAFLRKLPANSHVVIDEAYHHFAESPAYASFLDRPVDDARVIVARTFSKVYGLAGLRLGYGIAAQKTIARMKLYLTQDSINGLVVKAAATALADKAGTDQAIRRNAAEREEFFRQANARRLRPIDSHTNFVMMQVHRPAGEVIDDFGKRNILIGRRFPPLDNYVRVSLGTAEEMRQFWRVWDSLPYGNAHWEPKQSRCPPACVG